MKYCKSSCRSCVEQKFPWIIKSCIILLLDPKYLHSLQLGYIWPLLGMGIHCCWQLVQYFVPDCIRFKLRVIHICTRCKLILHLTASGSTGGLPIARETLTFCPVVPPHPQPHDPRIPETQKS